MENTVLFVLGLLLLGAGLIEIGIMIPRHLNDEVNSQIIANEQVIDGNKYYTTRFLNNTDPDETPSYQQYYFYNFTNPAAALQGKLPIQAEEIGPFTFRKYFAKYNSSFFDDKVQAKWWIYYVYEQSMSYMNLPMEEVVICSPDPAYAGLVTATRSNATIQMILSVKYMQFAITCRTAAAWFNGYGITLPPPLGIYVGFPGYLGNQTVEQALASPYSVWNTGIWDQYQLMNLLQYQGLQAETCWLSPQQIHASDNSQFPLGLTSDQSVFSYLPPLHRVVKWVYDQHDSVSGLGTLKYTVSQSNFQNSTLNPDNVVYYQNGPNGLMNLTACNKPLNVWISQTHFYGCDASFGQQFTPPIVSNSSDLSYMQIEPNTGMPVELSLGFQQARYLEIPTGIKIQVPTLLPIFWTQLHTQISSSDANTFSDKLYTTKDIAQIIWWVGIVAGSFICFVALLIFIRVQVRHRRRKLLLKRSMRQSSRQRLLLDREAARTRRLTTT